MHILKFYLYLEIYSRQTFKESFKKNRVCNIAKYYFIKTYLKIKRSYYANEARLRKY